MDPIIKILYINFLIPGGPGREDRIMKAYGACIGTYDPKVYEDAENFYREYCISGYPIEPIKHD